MPRVSMLVVSLGLLFACAGERTPGSSQPILVGAAASLQRVLPELIAEYEQATGRRVEVSFASSGALAAQISRGAPVDLYLSADDRWVEELAGGNHILPDSVRPYARGRLALVSCVPDIHPVPPLSALPARRYGRIGLANPDLAPYGAAAVHALQRAGVWPEVEPKIVRGENVGQVEKYCASGNVDLALVPLALVITQHYAHVEIDPALHPPLAQTLAVPRSAPQPLLARAFAEFLATPAAIRILERHGFRAPSDSDTR